MSIMAQVEGSGTTVPLSEKAALKVGAGPPVGGGPTMSVPTRSQSGAMPGSSRVQLCKSVKPGGNGVPGATMGFGAESQRKSPLASWT